ncbi:MAG TPA: hypothetical protein VLM78_00490 [Anaerolineales bacterium]|nr:hypothetical protein [Anaerolineales bacterium]
MQNSFYECLRREIQIAPASMGKTNAIDPQMGFAATGVAVGVTVSTDGADSIVAVGAADSVGVGNAVSVGYTHGVGGIGVAVKPK